MNNFLLKQALLPPADGGGMGFEADVESSSGKVLIESYLD